jgi:hypothetical protein
MKNFRLKFAILEKGESQDRQAQILGCDPSVVSRIVNGWNEPE